MKQPDDKPANDPSPPRKPFRFRAFVGPTDGAGFGSTLDRTVGGRMGDKR
jgi:hypothetical protein